MPESTPATTLSTTTTTPIAEGTTVTFAALYAYVRAVADALALRDWTIHLLLEPAAPGRAAEVLPIWGRKYADIRLGTTWEQMSLVERRSAILHELIELHHAQARYVAEQGLKRGFQGVYAQAVEVAIDGLADALAPCFALPPG